MRLDVYLTERGDLPSRSKAKSAIECGLVSVNGAVCTSPSAEVTENAQVIVTPSETPVGRGGLKLAAALDGFKINPVGRVCLDVGASTGGFTECLLNRGAARVYATDVGHGQLHGRLRADPRVVVSEGVNARNLSREIIPEDATLTVMDVSFISQRLIYPVLTGVLADGAELITLIKPQFEAGREHLNKQGIVRDEREHRRVIEELRLAARAVGLHMDGVIDSPILGGDGNKEYLAHFYYKKL